MTTTCAQRQNSTRFARHYLIRIEPLTLVRFPGKELLISMSLTNRVPAAVPSLFQSSALEPVLSATKNNVPLTSVRPFR